MIESVLNSFYTVFFWGSIIFGPIFLIFQLSKIVPHLCYYRHPDGRFDMGAVFCLFCIHEFLSRYIHGRTRTYLGKFLLMFTPTYILKLLIVLHHTDEIDVLSLVYVCLLCILTRMVNYEIYRLHPLVNATIPLVSGFAFFIIYMMYFRLTVNFVLVSTILCFFNMTIGTIQSYVLWAMFFAPSRQQLMLERQRLEEFYDYDYESERESDN